MYLSKVAKMQEIAREKEKKMGSGLCDRQDNQCPPTFLIRSIASRSLSIEAAYESRIHPGA